MYHQPTNPINCDTDGDGIYDPDDRLPLSYRCGCSGNSGPYPKEYGDGEQYVSDDEGGSEQCEEHEENDPLDSDGDGLQDWFEILSGTDPNNPDTDGDLLLDGDEISLGLDPNDWDTDNDLLADGSELGVPKSSTDGHVIDSDNDGLL